MRPPAGYVPKFSDSFAAQWLNDEASDYAVARRVLSEYHPLEAEMWLQLGAHLFHQCSSGGTVRKFVPPTPWSAEPSELVKAYMSSEWRDDAMSLLEFLRRTNPKGDISQAMKKRHAKEKLDDDESLEAFCNRIDTKGEVMIAAGTAMRFSDVYYAQWSVLNVPFRALKDLLFEGLDLVPETFQGFAVALHHKPVFWRNLDAVKADLELEAFADHAVKSNLAMVQAHTAVVDGYLSGELVLGRDEIPTVRRMPTGAAALPPKLDKEQWKVVDRIHGLVVRSIELASEQEETGDYALEDKERRWAPLAVLGPAGSGKSTAVQTVVQMAIDQGARVGIACPTRMLVARIKEKFPHYDVDSIHAMFELFKPEHLTLDAMWFYDLVIIEEVSQVSQAVFERLLRLWDAAMRRPVLVFVGDFAQLRGVDPSRALDSLRWSEVHKLTLHTMRRCKCEKLKKKLELLRSAKPDKKQLAGILSGHKAPSRAHRATHEMQEIPSADEIGWIFHENPDTTFVTITRANAAWVNEVVVGQLFADKEPVRVIPGDPEGNADNFEGVGMAYNEPIEIPIHLGMRLTFTRNINKEMDYVNGMSCVVLGVHRAGLRVRTDTNHIVCVYPWTDEWKTCFYPVRIGYAHTLMKMQGATLKDMTVWLDVANVEAAAYVALSRVEYDANWRFVGNPTVHHFTPATAV